MSKHLIPVPPHFAVQSYSWASNHRGVSIKMSYCSWYERQVWAFTFLNKEPSYFESCWIIIQWHVLPVDLCRKLEVCKVT